MKEHAQVLSLLGLACIVAGIVLICRNETRDMAIEGGILIGVSMGFFAASLL